jgi:shikimate 5-dehydrogenase
MPANCGSLRWFDFSLAEAQPASSLVHRTQPVATSWSTQPPLGMSANDPLPVAGDLLNSSMFVGDVVAGHGVTSLLQAAQAAGCKTCDGVQMVEAGMNIMPDFLLCS